MTPARYICASGVSFFVKMVTTFLRYGEAFSSLWFTRLSGDLRTKLCDVNFHNSLHGCWKRAEEGVNWILSAASRGPTCSYMYVATCVYFSIGVGTTGAIGCPPIKSLVTEINSVLQRYYWIFGGYCCTRWGISAFVTILCPCFWYYAVLCTRNCSIELPAEPFSHATFLLQM